METAELDFNATYEVADSPGVAWRLLGFVEVYKEDPDEPGDYVKEDDLQWVRAYMVGDDRVFEIDIDDLTPLSDNDYCSCCGQLGCGWS